MLDKFCKIIVYFNGNMVKKDREKNYKSHVIYKQDYIKWEDERGE